MTYENRLDSDFHRNDNEKKEMLHQIFTRLCFHYSLDSYYASKARSNFITSLLCYPDDLICAAYRHVLRHAQLTTYPNPEAFIAFMQPEYERRQAIAAEEVCYG